MPIGITLRNGRELICLSMTINWKKVVYLCREMTQNSFHVKIHSKIKRKAERLNFFPLQIWWTKEIFGVKGDIIIVSHPFSEVVLSECSDCNLGENPSLFTKFCQEYSFCSVSILSFVCLFLLEIRSQYKIQAVLEPVNFTPDLPVLQSDACLKRTRV